MKLLGPLPFDLTAPAQSARLALSTWTSAESVVAEPLQETDGTAPGLSFLVDDEGRLLGFWLTFGDNYLDDGPGPARIPPFAEDLLEAATEEIWWERMKVAPLVGGRWKPIVVLEWPPELADRCGAPPPGQRALEEDEPEPERWGDEPETSWLEPVAERPPGFDEPEYIPTALRRWDDLPERRSIVTIVRGDMGRRAGIHDGHFALAAPPPQPVLVPEGLPLELWIAESAPEHVPKTSGLLDPVRLFGGRAAFPLPGWLVRDLEPTPADPDDILPGELVARDIHSRFWGQVALAGTITVLVLLGVLGFSGGLHLAGLPRLESAAAVPPVDAQPAMSVCSADHRRFVDAFRCQVRHLAEGGTPGEADCSSPDPQDDLQPSYCGLLDRGLDNWVDPDGHGYAELAAASACFDVLGAPWPYARPGSEGRMPDPDRLLADGQLKVSSLVDLVAELDTACTVYRDKLEARTSAAVLATHVGNRSREGEALRDLAFDHATTGVSATQKACWTTGRGDPVDHSTALRGMCGPDAAEDVLEKRKSWRALAGTSETPVTERYVAARFGKAGTARGLWACHLELAEGIGGPPVDGLWELALPRPRSYGGAGVTSQLRLDAGLATLRDAGTNDACWRVVDGMLGSYEPVHPLLAAVDDDGWPSGEQQVCGQVCAAAYGLEDRPTTWVTPGTDLSVCVADMPPGELRYDKRLDQLSMPWNLTPEGEWVAPTTEEVCAFNLVAQGRLLALTDERNAPLWAGESGAGSGIAGGPQGAAVLAAEALGTYGRNRSTSTCSQVASQCFAGELLTVLAEHRTESHRWRDLWRRRVADIPRVKPGEVHSPWCRLVRPYLQEDGTLPEGEFDFPCALGVDQARKQVEGQIAALAAGSFNTGAPR
ncbi:MAG: hypothetical protein H6736_18385 [Alphaproteobacteria bacterium]|nr:hypothetical protein [Alphaproteobacteria bacterium]MCB9693784.1 hypothetical protein [Alphaproteobacteria bacterium]